MSDLYESLVELRNELSSMSEKDSLLEAGLDQKLSRIDSNYKKKIQRNFEYILYRSNCKSLKALHRYQQTKEKKGNEEKPNRGFIEVI